MFLQHTGVFALSWEQESREGGGAGGENSRSWAGTAPGEGARTGDVGKGSFFVAFKRTKHTRSAETSPGSSG